LTATQYLCDADWRDQRHVRVINLCDMGVGASGYQVSLQAQGRDHRVLPIAEMMLDGTWRRKYGAALPELYELLYDIGADQRADAEDGDSLALLVLFGDAGDARFAEIGQRAF